MFWGSRSLVEAMAGLVLVGGGIFVQATESREVQQDPANLVVGGVFVAAGSILLSWIASRALAEKQVSEAKNEEREDLNKKLDSISRNIGQAAGQISQTVEQVALGSMHSQTGFALVSQATRMIYGQVNEIAMLRGSTFDSGYLVETAEELDKLARELNLKGLRNDRVANVRNSLKQVAGTLTASTGVSRSYSNTDVTCPFCESANQVRLGDIPGDTAVANCTVCGRTFNSHRASTGSAFTRPIGRTGTRSQDLGRWDFTCTQCSNSMSCPIDGRGPRIMVCTECFRSLLIDPVARSTEAQGQFTVVTPEIVGRSGSRPRVECPDCRIIRTAILNNGRDYIALCYDDQNALVVAHDAFDTWRLAKGLFNLHSESGG